MGLNQFQKTLDENTESQFEIDHGSVTTVVRVNLVNKDLVELNITKCDNQPDAQLHFTPQQFFMEPCELEDLGRFIQRQGSDLRIRGTQTFMEDVRLSLSDWDEKQEDMFAVDNDHVNLQRESLYRDVSDTVAIKLKMRSSKNYCKRFYATLCNNVFAKNSQEDSYSWRASGGFVADILGHGDYLSWYCAGNEGHVDEEVLSDLKSMGWDVIEDYYDQPEYVVNTQLKLNGENDEQK